MEAELIAAVVTAPDDDGPRMVYADWLQQRGDPRGELIAVQCRLAAGDPDDADRALVDRERELLATNAFTAPLEAIAAARYELRRGFVEHVDAYRRLALDDEHLFELAPLLHSMAIPGTQIERSPTPAWSRFDTITLREVCYISEDSAREFARSPHIANLRRLHIVNNATTLQAVAALLELPNELVHFGFGLNGPSAERVREGGAEVVRYLERTTSPLRSLALSCVELPTAKTLARFPLAKLALHETQTAVASLYELPLTTLELVYDAAPRDLDLPALLSALPSLRRLRVRGAHLTKRDVQALLPHASHLARLDLARNSIDDAGVTALCELPAWLDVADNPVDATTLARVRARNRAVVDPPPPVYPRDVIEQLERNHKIYAIKLHREDTGAGLLESKLAVERINDELGLPPTNPRPMLTWLAP